MDFFSRKHIARGMTLFLMFFGAGNIILPIRLGIVTSASIFIILGFIVSTVLLPQIGILTVALCGGKSSDFFNMLGAYISSFVKWSTWCIIGPGLAIPRCISVCNDSLFYLLSSFCCVPNSLIFLFNISIIFFFSISTYAFYNIFGSIFTPIIIGCLGLLVIYSGMSECINLEIIKTKPLNDFLTGTSNGFLTMDLLAGIWFAHSLIQIYRISDTDSSPKSFLKLIYPIIWCMLCLCITYISLIWMGNKSNIHTNVFDINTLYLVADNLSNGRWFSSHIMAILVFLASFTTAIGLFESLPLILKSEFNLKIKLYKLNLILLIISSCIAAMGFRYIMEVSSIILNIIYPPVVLACFTSILSHKMSVNIKNILVKAVFYLGFVYNVIKSVYL